ncbi:unnamed protein product [Discula destructiva]
MPPPTHAPWRALALRPAIASTSAARTTVTTTTTTITTGHRLFHTTPALAYLRPAIASTSAARTTVTTTTTTITTGHRLFHTTPALAYDDDVPIPPESPRFFSLPDLPQSDETKPPPIKGSLPVPRQIFSKRAHGAHKISPTFVPHTAPRSRAELAGHPPKSEKDAWKRLMADSRRQALGDGVASLWRRKVTRDRKLADRSRTNQQRNRAAGFAPDRADDVHTRGSVTQATLETRVVRDPQYAEHQRVSAARTAAVEAAKSEARKDAIQRLYVEASHFIVTDADLAAKVDEIFMPDYFVKPGKARGVYFGAENIWQAYGRPDSVGAMFAELKGTTRDMTQTYTSESSKTNKRQKIVAGELTGGALSVLAPTEIQPAVKSLSPKLPLLGRA